MKILILSDTHFEQISPEAENIFDAPPEVDLVIIAGDFHNAKHAVRHARTLFPSGPLVMVAGNHEHYRTGWTVEQGLARMRAHARADSSANKRRTIFLENERVKLNIAGERVRIFGCTLWTDFNLFGNNVEHASRATKGITDYRLIKGSVLDNLTTFETSCWHARSREFLEYSLRYPYDGKKIVVTHHLPSLRSVHPRFKDDPLTPAFASDCDDLLKLGADLWVHGHTHDSCDYYVNGKTRVVCNPMGYSGPGGPKYGVENPSFAKYRVIEI